MTAGQWFDAWQRVCNRALNRKHALLLFAGVAAKLTEPAARVLAGPGEKKEKRQRRRKRRQRRHAADDALYPDLRVLLPSDLRFAQLSDGTPILRFTNTVWNAGQGRLELEAATSPPDSGEAPLFQNLYDAPVGGKRVGRRRVAGKIVYHPSHNHYHFADFASYRLLKRDAAGDYQPAGEGTKTSFCITDNERLDSPFLRQYLSCERDLQGLTPGWGDTYAYNLPEQWVVLGDAPLADGDYGLESIVDPKGLLDEDGRTGNNSAVAYFAVVNGQIELAATRQRRLTGPA